MEKAFSAEAKAFGDQIVSDIKDQFIEKLKVTEWMEQEVIDLAISKVHNIVQKIGYPDKVKAVKTIISWAHADLSASQSPNIMDPAKLKKYYASVNINASTYFENAVSIIRNAEAEEWASLGKPVDRDEW